MIMKRYVCRLERNLRQKSIYFQKKKLVHLVCDCSLLSFSNYKEILAEY